MTRLLPSSAFCMFLTLTCLGQNTVGTLSLKDDLAYEGYNLIYPHNQSNVYLINNCGDILHSWTDDIDFRPGNVAYLLENGNLVKTKRRSVSVNDPIWAGGGGAIIDIRDWDNNVLAIYKLNNENDRLHHDIAITGKGTVLMIAWELKSNDEVTQAGRDSALLANEILWPDYILEWDPISDVIIWEWHVWDHLIQDFDETKDNFGVVGDHAELIDINYDEHDGHQDWLHANSMHYNSFLNHILISIPYFNEIWIIDHSTTTEEAASHQGGNSGKGGDLLYRWGNPQAYGVGTIEDKHLFFQHGAKWVDPSAELDSEDYGLISLYNNRVNTNYSSLNVFRAEFDMYDNQYRSRDRRFLPIDFVVDLVHPDTLEMASSNGLSSVQILPNDNLLAIAGRWGYAYELTPTNDLVWEYRVPLRGGDPVEQGTELTINNNITFRIDRYSVDYPAFDNRELTSGSRLELNPNSFVCNVISATQDDVIINKNMQLIQNPIVNILRIDVRKGDFIEMVDLAGHVSKRVYVSKGINEIDIYDIQNGLYIIRNEFGETFKILKLGF